MRKLSTATLVPLEKADSLAEVGAKALRLAELAREGIPVPETYVLPPDSEEFGDPEVLEALGGCVAVRSSATAEDGAVASFAGQFLSVLGVRTVPELLRAIRAVRASVDGDAVRAYCRSRRLSRPRQGRIEPSWIRMAVVLQRMVQAEVAGVLFTADPIAGDERQIVIEACPGVSDELLAGRRSPVRITIRDDGSLPSSDLLTQGQIGQLVELGRRIQRIQGSPQDIEWAIEDGRIWILQTRPITRLGFSGIDGVWTNADFRDGGVSSDVVTPLMWSLYEFAWEIALKGYLRELHLLDGDFVAARIFYGRPYWNLGAVKQCVKKLPGFVEREFDRDIAAEPTYEGNGDRTPVTLGNLLGAIPTLLAARRAFRAQERMDKVLLSNKLLRPFEVDPRLLDDPELIHSWNQLIREAYRRLEVNYFRTIFNCSIAKMDLKNMIDGLPVSYTALVSGLDDLAYFETMRELWLLGNGRNGSLQSFLDRHGYHSRRALDLREPRWKEEPGFVAEMVQKLSGTDSPAEAVERQRARYQEELRRARSLLGFWRSGRFERRLERLRRTLWLREEMRDLSTRMYARIRTFALEFGRRAAEHGNIARRDDIFYLTFTEIPHALQSPLHRLVRHRRDHEMKFRNFRPPNEIGRGYRFADSLHPGRRPFDCPQGRQTGIGSSPGIATGTVRVVRSLDEAGKLERSDVLVCPYTDPGWTPLLGIVGAVVAETGGLLSHAAVLCREYGVPAVLNVANATRIFQDGQQVRVDGDSGTVDLLESAGD